MDYHKIFGNLNPNDVRKLKSALKSVYKDFSSIINFNHFLRNTGINQYFTDRLPQKGTPSEFTEQLVDKFLDYKINSQQPNYHPLLEFSNAVLENLERYNLDDEEIRILTFFRNKIKTYLSSEAYARRNATSNLLAWQKDEQEEISTSSSIKNFRRINRTIIIERDLEDFDNILNRNLGFRGIFAFSINGNATILEEYIIHKILLKHKRKKKYNQFPGSRKLIKIRLYSHSIDRESNIIEQELKRRNICNELVDLAKTENKLDTIIIIWNYELNRNQVKKIALEFLTAIKTECSSSLINSEQCLLIILANVGCQVNIDGFISLKTPKKFVLEGENGLLEWLNYEIRQQTDLQGDDIEQYLKRIKHHNGHFTGTYREIQDIMDELNERYD